MLRKFVKNIYPQKNKCLYFLFDIALMYYLVAYLVYYQDETGFGTIRMSATILLFGMGIILYLLTGFRRVSIIVVWYFLFILFSICSMLWAKYDTQVTEPLISMVRILCVFIFLSVRIKKESDVEIALLGFVIAVVYLDLYVGKLMVDYYSFADFYLHRFGDNFAYNSNSVAVSNVLAILVILHWFKQVRKPVVKIFGSVALAFFIIILFLTGSKKGLMGLLFGAFLFFYQRVKGIKKFERLFLGLLGVVLAFWAVLNIPMLYDLMGYRLDEMFGLLFQTGVGDISTQNRVGLIQEAIQIWLSHPLLGVGLNNFSMLQDIGEAGYYAHNNYVELLADLGLIGFVLYYGFIFKLARRKIATGNDLQVFVKTAVWSVLFFDIGVVSYQSITVHLFICLAFLTLTRLKRTSFVNEIDKNYAFSNATGMFDRTADLHLNSSLNIKRGKL